jgi:predicted nucleic acid-binding protein
MFLVDKSALARMQRESVSARVRAMAELGRVATCGITELELLYSARSHADHAAIRARRALAWTWAPIDDATFRRAIEVQGELARTGHHRLPIPDLLIAAAAERAGMGVLHYDADFDRIAAVTGQPTEWVVPRGSVP